MKPVTFYEVNETPMYGGYAKLLPRMSDDERAVFNKINDLGACTLRRLNHALHPNMSAIEINQALSHLIKENAISRRALEVHELD